MGKRIFPVSKGVVVPSGRQGVVLERILCGYYGLRGGWWVW